VSTSWRRPAAWAGIALLVPIAVVLVLAGVDLIRSPGQLTSEDTRFQSTPGRHQGVWDVGGLPADLNERLLGLEDDLAYREISALYLRSEPGKVLYDGIPNLEKLRAKAQFELASMSRDDSEAVRKSRLLTLDGVMTLDFRSPSSQEREALLRAAASAFRAAIALDPENDDAKTNLELVLSVFGPIIFAPPKAPSHGTDQGQMSGQGRPGTGY
jgi:hypothetical protein